MASDARPAEDVPWRALHPASVVVNLVPRTWALVRGFWPLLLVVVFGGASDRSWVADLPILLWLFVAAVGNTVVHWATLRYRLADGRLELRSGLLNRQKRVFSPRKIQHVEVVRNIFHRVTGLAEVRIETASGDEVEGLLSALSIDEAQRLVGALQDARAQTASAPVPGEGQAPPLVSNGPAELAMYGATSLRLGWVLVALGVGFEAWTSMQQGAIDGLVDDATLQALPTAWLTLGALGIVLASWVGGILGAMLRHHGFELRPTRDSLVVRQGLTTTRRIELPVRRVQLVQVRASWLRRWLGFGSVRVETASAQGSAQGLERAAAMVPVVPADHLQDVLDQALPGVTRPASTSLQPPDPRALRRARVRAVVWGLLISGVVVWRLSWWGLPALVLPALLWWRAALDHRHQGWAVTDDLVVSRRGYLTRTTTWAAAGRVQSVSVEQGPFLRRYGLAQVVVRMAGGSAVVLPLLDEAEAWDLSTTLAERVDRRARRVDDDPEDDDVTEDLPMGLVLPEPMAPDWAT